MFHFRNEAGPTQAPQLRDPEVPREAHSPQIPELQGLLDVVVGTFPRLGGS